MTMTNVNDANSLWAQDFQLANYIYRTITGLMKQSLDMGTLLSNDPHKLRAYKEQTKKLFKSKWFEIASIFENAGLIEPCLCMSNEETRNSKCDVCKGSRYVSTTLLSAEVVEDIGIFVTNGDRELTDKLWEPYEKSGKPAFAKEKE